MGNFNRFGNMNPPAEVMRRSYLMAEEPFCIYGNLYFVGNTWCSSHLIDTGEGLILLDTPAYSELAYLINNIYKLGFKLEDLKYILVSHAHHDHYGAVKALVHLTGAKTFIGRVDGEDMDAHPEAFANMGRDTYRYSETFKADVQLEDGDIVELGNTKIRCVLTPGHTIGVMSHFWTAYGEEGPKKVGIYGGAGFVTLRKSFREAHGLGDWICEAFSTSIDKVWNEEVDIMLGNHPFHNDTYEKHERAASRKENPFIDPAEWQRFLTELRMRYAEFRSKTEEEVMEMYKESSFLTYRDICSKYLEEK